MGEPPNLSLTEILKVHLQDFVVGIEEHHRLHDVAVMCECTTDALLPDICMDFWPVLQGLGKVNIETQETKHKEYPDYDIVFKQMRL